MTTYTRHWQPCIATMLFAAMLFMTPSCSDSSKTLLDEDQPAVLTIHVQAPKTASSATRTDVGEVGAYDNEKGLYQTYVWVFDSSKGDDAGPAGSLSQNLNGVEEATLQLSIDRNVLSSAPDLDIFVAANVESIPSAYYYMGQENPPVTRGFLKEMVFGKKDISSTSSYSYDDFGTANPVHTPEAQKGIPMSQYALSQKVIENGMLDRPVNVALRHAVSKMRFIFARETGVTDAVITGITLGDGLIPTTTHLFPTQPADPTSEESVALAKRTPNLPENVTYENGFTFNEELANGDILEHENPASLAIQSGETAQAYTSRLATEFAGKEKSLYYGLTYLRETGKKLTGTIHYKLGGTPYDIPFEMAEECDFTRNHEYIVYAYFKKAGLNLTVKAMPWDLQTITNEFSNTVSLAEGGMLKWTDGTYFSMYDATKELILKPDINYPAEFTFNLASPRGCVWHAVLRTKSGNPDAFELRDPDGNAKSEGIVDGNEVKLRVHALEQYPAQMNKAELQIVVRCNGITLPVDILTNDKKNFTIIQNKN